MEFSNKLALFRLQERDVILYRRCSQEILPKLWYCVYPIAWCHFSVDLFKFVNRPLRAMECVEE